MEFDAASAQAMQLPVALGSRYHYEYTARPFYIPVIQWFGP
jgi:hypothetical protein